MSAGFVDPRAGKEWADRQPMALTQSWEVTSELWWALGLRYHPELATKWLEGGGQFAVAKLVDKPPVERTLEQDMDEVLELFAEENPAFVENIRKLRDSGTPAERADMIKNFERNISALTKMASMMEGSGDNPVSTSGG